MSSNDEVSWLQERLSDRRWAAAALFAVFVVLCLIGVLITLALGGGAHQASPPATPAGAPPVATSVTASPATAVGDSGRPPGCHTTDTDQTIPTTTPTGVTWSLNAGVAVPSSATAGPMLTDGDLKYCYADTPLGAVLAASNLFGGGGSQSHAQAMVAHTLVRSGAASTAPVATTSEAPAASSTAQRLQLAGFRIGSNFTSGVATVLVATTFPAGTAASTPTYGEFSVQLQWQDGDWRFAPASTGAPFLSVGTTRDLSTYVPWSGVN